MAELAGGLEACIDASASPRRTSQLALRSLKQEKDVEKRVDGELVAATQSLNCHWEETVADWVIKCPTCTLFRGTKGGAIGPTGSRSTLSLQQQSNLRCKPCKPCKNPARSARIPGLHGKDLHCYELQGSTFWVLHITASQRGAASPHFSHLHDLPLRLASLSSCIFPRHTAEQVLVLHAQLFEHHRH